MLSLCFAIFGKCLFECIEGPHLLIISVSFQVDSSGFLYLINILRVDDVRQFNLFELSFD